MVYDIVPDAFDPIFEVVSCYVEYGGSILLLYRNNGKLEGNKWGVPAGKIDAGESEWEAMIREIQEETGLGVIPMQIEYLKKVFVRYPAYDFVYHMFRIELKSKPEILINPKEHQLFRWVIPREALAMNLVTDLDECIKMFYAI
ncbi:MAG: NUDIX hydrolase [Patescibacteria group bacterium]